MAHSGLLALPRTTAAGCSCRFVRSSTGSLDGPEAPHTAITEATHAASCSCPAIVSAEEGCRWRSAGGRNDPHFAARCCRREQGSSYFIDFLGKVAAAAVAAPADGEAGQAERSYASRPGSDLLPAIAANHAVRSAMSDGLASYLIVYALFLKMDKIHELVEIFNVN